MKKWHSYRTKSCHFKIFLGLSIPINCKELLGIRRRNIAHEHSFSLRYHTCLYMQNRPSYEEEIFDTSADLDPEWMSYDLNLFSWYPNKKRTYTNGHQLENDKWIIYNEWWTHSQKTSMTDFLESLMNRSVSVIILLFSLQSKLSSP